MKTKYQAPNLSLWQGRKDSLPGERFFHHVAIHDLCSASLLPNLGDWVVLGFASDEGIRRNQGRLGASQGPQVLRQQLAKLACHHSPSFIDIGDVVCVDGDLEACQAALARLVKDCQALGYKTLVFGGGHEMAFGHYQGLSIARPSLGIVNFDAHFDLRPLPSTKEGNSGTPFLQIAYDCAEKSIPFSYTCLGIQPFSNTATLYTAASQYQVAYLTAEEMFQQSLNEQCAFLESRIREKEALYITICLDVFAEAYAPGVSAPQSLGVTPTQILPLLKYLLQTGKVIGIDLAELSPPLDEGTKTARLAAMIAAVILDN